MINAISGYSDIFQVNSASSSINAVDKAAKSENMVAFDYATITEESKGQPINTQDKFADYPASKNIASTNSFSRQIVNYLEKQDFDLSALTNGALPSSSPAGASSGHIAPVMTSLADGTTVNVVYSGEGGAKIQLSMPDGQKLEIDNITSNVRFSASETGEIRMITADATTTFDINGNRISTIGGGDPLAGTDGNDIIINFDGAEVNGGAGNDLIINYSSNSAIYGGSGNDKVILAAGNNASQSGLISPNINVCLGDGDDSLEMAEACHATINIDGGNGNDSIILGNITGAENININGGAGNDKITIGKISAGHGKPVSISGGDGNDRIHVNELVFADAKISGDAGNDEISVGTFIGKPFAGSSSVNGGSGNDIINIGYASDSVIDGGDGDNQVSVETMFRSILVNGSGNDTLTINNMLSSMIISPETLNAELWQGESREVDNETSTAD